MPAPFLSAGRQSALVFLTVTSPLSNASARVADVAANLSVF
jgi:hypothetical protein